MKKNAIIIGASEGIGRALAGELSRAGWRVGLAARREGLLREVAAGLPGESFIMPMDVTKTGEAEKALETLARDMGGADLVVISAGTGHINPALESAPELETIDTNVRGFTALACAAFRHFRERGGGHLVGISSVAAVRGGAGAVAYSASKAFVSSYLEGLRLQARKEGANITVTDIRPGFVNTKMAESDHIFWMSSPQTAARQILGAIDAKKSCAYVTRRWRLVAAAMRVMPERFYCKL